MARLPRLPHPVTNYQFQSTKSNANGMTMADEKFSVKWLTALCKQILAEGIHRQQLQVLRAATAV